VWQGYIRIKTPHDDDDGDDYTKRRRKVSEASEPGSITSPERETPFHQQMKERYISI
jgi:hypothetical protein